MKNECLSIESLEKYIDYEDQLTADELFLIEDHLSQCKLCAGKVRTLLQLNQIWTGWTARTPNSDIKECSHKPSNLSRLLMTVKVIVSENGKAGRLLIENLAGSASTGQEWSFSYCGTRGCGPDQATTDLPLQISASSYSGDKYIIIKSSIGMVELSLEGFSRNDLPEVSLNTEQGETLLPQLAQSKRQDCWTARFENLAPREFIMYFKTREPSKDQFR